MCLFYFTKNYVFVVISKQHLDKTSRCIPEHFCMLNTQAALPSWATRSCTAPLCPQMFLTVNLVTETKARATNHQRVWIFWMWAAVAPVHPFLRMPSTGLRVENRVPLQSSTRALQSPAAAEPIKQRRTHCSLRAVENSLPLMRLQTSPRAQHSFQL